MPRQQRYLILLLATIVPAAMIAAVPASADSLSAGSPCSSSQVGDIESDNGSAIVCLATEEGAFSWVDDTGAADAIAELEKQGYNVTVHRVGNAPLSACVVTGTRNPITTTRDDRVGSDSTIVINKTIQVELDCHG